SLKTSIKTITYLSDIGCLEIQGASLKIKRASVLYNRGDYQQNKIIRSECKILCSFADSSDYLSIAYYQTKIHSRHIFDVFF
ncbi:hypothetical protein ACE4Z6_02065, partial [Salmonella enterica]|uniref:hypothetical protein n=1 Tax=Salmonella enterica TaxID=28901 RepID=UPI003D2AF1E8